MCPAGTKVLGGGYSASGAPGADFDIMMSSPDPGLGGWTVTSRTAEGTVIVVNVFAVCATVQS